MLEYDLVNCRVLIIRLIMQLVEKVYRWSALYSQLKNYCLTGREGWMGARIASGWKQTAAGWVVVENGLQVVENRPELVGEGPCIAGDWKIDRSWLKTNRRCWVGGKAAHHSWLKTDCRRLRGGSKGCALEAVEKQAAAGEGGGGTRIACSWKQTAAGGGWRGRGRKIAYRSWVKTDRRRFGGGRRALQVVKNGTRWGKTNYSW